MGVDKDLFVLEKGEEITLRLNWVGNSAIRAFRNNNLVVPSASSAVNGYWSGQTSIPGFMTCGHGGFRKGDEVRPGNSHIRIGEVHFVQYEHDEDGDFAFVKTENGINLINTINYNSTRVRINGRTWEPPVGTLVIRMGTIGGGNYQFIIVDQIQVAVYDGFIWNNNLSSAYHLLGTRPNSGDSGGAIIHQTNSGNINNFAGVFKGDDGTGTFNYYTPARYMGAFTPYT